MFRAENAGSGLGSCLGKAETYVQACMQKFWPFTRSQPTACLRKKGMVERG